MKFIKGLALFLLFLYPGIIRVPGLESRTRFGLNINSAQDAFSIALKNNPELFEKDWAILSYRAMERKANRSIFPSLEITSFVAPIYKINADPNNIYEYEKDYLSWGPSYNFQGSIIQPVYTFGRYSQGKKAARWGIKAKIEEKKAKINQIRLNISKYFWGYQLALSLLDLATEVEKNLKDIIKKAQEEFDKGSGKVSLGNLSKLKLFANELSKEKNNILRQKELSTFALKREMGLSEGISVTVSQKKLRYKNFDLKPLSFYTGFALRNRPELKQLSSGVRALKSLKELKHSELYPIIAVAGKLDASYTPNRENIDNPYFYDQYNRLLGGIGFGVKWKFDSGQTMAEAEKSEHQWKKLREKLKYARLSVPLETRKIYLELKHSVLSTRLTLKNLKIAKKWSLSAKLGFDSGILEAEELIEGLAAYMKSRLDYRKNLYLVHLKLAELGKCIGNHTVFIERKK